MSRPMFSQAPKAKPLLWRHWLEGHALKVSTHTNWIHSLKRWHGNGCKQWEVLWSRFLRMKQEEGSKRNKRSGEVEASVSFYLLGQISREVREKELLTNWNSITPLPVSAEPSLSHDCGAQRKCVWERRCSSRFKHTSGLSRWQPNTYSKLPLLFSPVSLSSDAK